MTHLRRGWPGRVGGYEMANDRQARVGTVRLTVRVPAGLPPERVGGAASGGLALHGA